MTLPIPEFVQNIIPIGGSLNIQANVAIFDQDFNQILTTVNIVDVRVDENARAMEHPVEDGTIITDHRIILPVEIELTLILNSTDYPSVYSQIQGLYYGAQLLTIQTRTSIYENQMITSLPHSETSELYSGVALSLSLRQVLIVSAQYNIKPKYPGDSNTVDRGTQQGAPANANQTAKATSGLLPP